MYVHQSEFKNFIDDITISMTVSYSCVLMRDCYSLLGYQAKRAVLCPEFGGSYVNLLSDFDSFTWYYF